MKKLGVLLVLSLVVAVCCGTGAAADTPTVLDCEVTLLGLSAITLDDGTTTVAGNSAVAALDAAANAEGFTYTYSYSPEYGVSIPSIKGLNTVQDADGNYCYWQFCVNDVGSMLNPGNVELKDGDKVSFYYSSYSSSNWEEPSLATDIATKATDVIHITVHIPEVIYEGSVILGSEEVTLTFDWYGTPTEISVHGNSIIAAFDVAANSGDITHSLSLNYNKDALTMKSIANLEQWGGTDNQQWYLNEEKTSISISDILSHGDKIIFYYSPYTAPTIDEATHVIIITVNIPEKVYDAEVTLAGFEDVPIPLATGGTQDVPITNGMSALQAASEKEGFTYHASVDSYGLGIADINGKAMQQIGGDWYWWNFYLNNEFSNDYLGNVDLKDGDTISLQYGDGKTVTYLVNIKVKITGITLYKGNVDIIQGTYVPTTTGGYSLQTDLGILALASSSLYGNFAYEEGEVGTTYNITKLGDKTANATHKWNVFVNEVWYGTTSDYNQILIPVETGYVVTALFVEKGKTNYEEAVETAASIVTVKVNSVSPLKEHTVSVPYDTTIKYGVDALKRASELDGFTYEMTADNLRVGRISGVGNRDTTEWGRDTGYKWNLLINGKAAQQGITELSVKDGDLITLQYIPVKHSGVFISNFDSADVSYSKSSLYTLNIQVGSSPSTVGVTNVEWYVDLGEKYNSGNEVMPDGYAVHNGKVYVSTWSAMSDGNTKNMGVYCFDANNEGEYVWKATGFNSRSGIAIDGDYLYVGYMSDDLMKGGVKRLKLADGTAAGDTGLIVYNAAWKGMTAKPLVLGDNVWLYVASNETSNASLYKCSLDLKSYEEIQLGGSPAAMFATASDSSDGKTLYAPGKGSIVAIDVEGKTVKWEADVEKANDYSVGTPVFYDGRVYFIVVGTYSDGSKSYTGKICSVNADDGKDLKIIPFSTNFPTTPIINGEFLYVTGSDGLSAYKIGETIPAWVHKGGDAGRLSPTLDGDVIYYGTAQAGTFYAVSTTGDTAGATIWKFKPEPKISGYNTIFEGKPIVEDGIVYVGNEASYAIYALSEYGRFVIPDYDTDNSPGNDSGANTDGSTSGGNTYVPPVQKPTVSYTPINPGQGQMTYTTNHLNYAPVTFTFDRMTAAGVLLSSGLNVVTAERWGGLYISAINGKSADNDPTGGWMCQVNGISIPTMINNYPVSNGDTVIFYYSESMSSSPDSSSHVYRFKVTTDGLQPLPTPTPTETPIPESFTPAESSQITFQIPTGVTITSTETGKTVSIDTGLIKTNEKSTVTVTEQAITITYPGVILTIDLTEYTKKGDLATATLGGMKAYLVPAPVTIPIGGYAL